MDNTRTRRSGDLDKTLAVIAHEMVKSLVRIEESLELLRRQVSRVAKEAPRGATGVDSVSPTKA